MQINLTEKEKGEAIITLQLAPEDYLNPYKAKLKEYGKQMKMPGFRPGKVPTGLVKRMHGKAILAEEIQKLIGESLDNYIKENELDLLGQPIPESQLDIEALNDTDGEEVTLDFSIARVMPFETPKLEEITLKKYQINVKDEDLEKSIDQLRDRFGEVTEPEESSKGDVISGKLDIPGEEEAFPFYLPFEKVKEGREEIFIGLKKGDKVELDMKEVFNEDDLDKLTGAKGQTLENIRDNKVTFEVERITHKKPAELNQTFFEQVFGKGVETEEEFKEKLREQHRSEFEAYAKNFLYRDLQKELSEKTAIELPEDFLKKVIKASAKEGEEKSEEQLQEEYPQYEKDLKWSLITQKYAKEAEINVDSDEVVAFTKDKIRQQLAQMGMAGADDAMIDQVAGNVLQNNDRVSEYYQELYYSKVFDSMLEKVAIEEKSIDSIEELPKE